MQGLEPRKIRILQAIVNDYVLTSKPVGSERLIDVYHIGCKSATVRNEMAEMAEMGYLAQPHTSAGRVPTDRGYRYYVDQLMDRSPALTPEEEREASMTAQRAQSAVEQILQQTCRILARLTSYVSLATDPSTGTATVRRVHLTEADPRHLLVVLLVSTGHVEHHLLDVEAVPSASDLQALANYVNAVVGGRDLDDVGPAIRRRQSVSELNVHSALLGRIFSSLVQAATGLTDRRMFLEGTSCLLKQPEFQDVQRLESLLNALEQRGALHQALSRTLGEHDITIVIGGESGWEPIQECSVILRSYRIGARAAGYLGVVGPTRMRYERAAAAVNLMAQNLSNVLTNLSLA
jgi:heat-inducible transcriptional repressor